jgi:hypothetical protein
LEPTVGAKSPWNVIEVKGHPANAFIPMLVTLLGMTIEVKGHGLTPF